MLLDKDGLDEVILALTPNLYVLKYINGNFVPVFAESSHLIIRLALEKIKTGLFAFWPNVKTEGNNAALAEWAPTEPFTGPPTPLNLTVKPLNESSIKVSWTSTGAPEYALYRKDEDGNEILYTVNGVTNFTDTILQQGKVYQYAIVAIDPTYSPNESNRSLD